MSSAGAYAGPRKIYEILGQNHENAHSLYKIRQWLHRVSQLHSSESS